MAKALTKTRNPHGLTDQQLRFCQHYARSLNATQAYKDAGYKAKTENAAGVSAHQILRNLKIQAYLGEVLNLTEVSVVHEAVAIGFANITDAIEWDEEGVSVIPSRHLTHRGKSAIKSIKCKKKTTTRTVGEVKETDVTVEWEVTLHDKLAALEKLIKKLGLYPKEESVSEADVLDKMRDMEIVPAWIADCANKIYSRAREEVTALLQGKIPEPLLYQLSKEREQSVGLSEDTFNRIRSEIMGISVDAESIPKLPGEGVERSCAGQDLAQK
jgi:phage terminase small subunit